MKPFFLSLAIVLFACGIASALENGLSRTPPMGWNPWNSFSSNENEQVFTETADSIVSSSMKDVGYAYVGPDDGVSFYRDLSGVLQSNLQRYPSGMKGLADYLHRKGLKFSIYTDVGTRTCTGDMPGTKDHEGTDMRSFAAWECDYTKVDWCNSGGLTSPSAYVKLRDSLMACGRPIVFSICNWGVANPANWGDSVGNLWRTGGDIGPDWSGILSIANMNAGLYTHAKPGSWNDPDMLEVGNGSLTDVRGRSHFSFWCMMASPLIAGNDIRKMSAATRATYTNIEAIAVNQDPLGIQGHKIRTAGSAEIWGSKKLFDSSYAALAFNNNGPTGNITVKWSDIGAAAGTSLYVRDLWKHTTSGPFRDSAVVSVATDEAAMLRFSKIDSFPIPPIIVADKYLVQFNSIVGQSGQLVDSIILTNKGSDVLPLFSVQENASWLSINVNRNGKRQGLVTTVQPSGLVAGTYHAVVRAANTEPRSGLPMSTVICDVELRVTDPNAVSTLWKHIDDTDPSVVYSSGWAAHTGEPADYNGTVHWNDQAGASVQFTFQGTAVRFFGRMQNNTGLADIYLDGVLSASGVNTYSCCWTTLYRVLFFEKTGLTNGTHTIKIVATGQKGDAAGYGTFVEVDEIEYTDGQTGNAVEDDGPVSFAKENLAAAPTPFNPSLNIRFTVGRPGVVDLSVYSSNGKKVASLFHGWRRAGVQMLSWNGRDNAGRALASGVYLVSFKTRTSSLIKKVSYLK